MRLIHLSLFVSLSAILDLVSKDGGMRRLATRYDGMYLARYLPIHYHVQHHHKSRPSFVPSQYSTRSEKLSISCHSVAPTRTPRNISIIPYNLLHSSKTSHLNHSRSTAGCIASIDILINGSHGLIKK